MTIGIYILRFKGTNKVYIGQSINIEKRYYQHKAFFDRGESSYKLNAAYKEYGLPSIEILIQCSKDQLDILEHSYIEKYNSIVNGFNTLENNSSLHNIRGEEHWHSKYSNEDIEWVFMLLLSPDRLTGKYISEETGVKYSTVSSISSGISHTWLKERHPKAYINMMNINRAKNIINNYPIILDPEGNPHTVLKLGQFAKKYRLHNGNLSNVLRGKLKSYKGWTLA